MKGLILGLVITFVTVLGIGASVGIVESKIEETKPVAIMLIPVVE